MLEIVIVESIQPKKALSETAPHVVNQRQSDHRRRGHRAVGRSIAGRFGWAANLFGRYHSLRFLTMLVSDENDGR
jgi:hypothetical protein